MRTYPYFKRRHKIRDRRLRLTFLSALIIVLAFHFCAITFYLLPLNPVNIFHGELFNFYLEPFFTQDWHLFAPNPPTTNERYLIQLRLRRGGEPDILETEWLDVTTPLIRQFWRNPLSSSVLRFRTIANISDDYRQTCIKPSSEPHTPSAYELHNTSLFKRLLGILAHELCDGTEYEPVAVRARLISEDIVPFSEWESGDVMPHEPKSLTMDWFSCAEVDSN
jgi:hypothetical protein